jgi:hypothetical protein
MGGLYTKLLALMRPNFVYYRLKKKFGAFRRDKIESSLRNSSLFGMIIFLFESAQRIDWAYERPLWPSLSAFCPKKCQKPATCLPKLSLLSVKIERRCYDLHTYYLLVLAKRFLRYEPRSSGVLSFRPSLQHAVSYTYTTRDKVKPKGASWSCAIYVILKRSHA